MQRTEWDRYAALPAELFPKIFTELCSTSVIVVLKAATKYRRICKKWQSVFSNSLYIWRPVFLRQGWSEALEAYEGGYVGDDSLFETAIDLYFANTFVFFCRGCLLPITRALIVSPQTPAEQVAEILAKLPANAHSSGRSVPKRPQPAIRNGRLITKLAPCEFHVEENNAVSPHHVPHLFMHVQNEAGQLVALEKHVAADISLFDVRMLQNVGWDTEAEHGCCGFTGFSGSNTRCRGCGLKYITSHADCMPTVPQFHFPVARSLALQVSRAQPYTLRLAQELDESFDASVYISYYQENSATPIAYWKHSLTQVSCSSLMQRDALMHDQLRQTLANLVLPSRVDEFLVASYEAQQFWMQDGYFAGRICTEEAIQRFLS